MSEVIIMSDGEGREETVIEWSLRHYELRHMGYKQLASKADLLKWAKYTLDNQNEAQIDKIEISKNFNEGETTILIKLINQ